MSTNSQTQSNEASQENWSEYRLTSVLFIDLVESLPLLERLGTDRYQFALRQFHALIVACVRDNHGSVQQFLGDGALCLFHQGAFGDSGAERALKAALNLRETIAGLSDGDLCGAEIRIGIATGRVLYADDAQDPLVGGAINLASRLQSSANPSEILICETTRSAGRQHFLLKSCGPLTLKGYSAPIDAWALKKARIVPNLQMPHGGDTPFVGRGPEKKKLLSLLAEAKDGRGVAVTVSAPAGGGKSRLVQEFLASDELRDCAKITLQCVRESQGVNFHPLQLYFQWMSGVTSDDSESDRKTKIRRVLKRVWGFEKAEADRFMTVIGLDTKSVSDEAPVLLRNWFFAVMMRRFIEARAGHKALILLVEDAHWMDPSSIEFFNSLVGQITEQPVLVIFTQRAEEGDAIIIDAPGNSEIHLEPLAAGAVETLAQEMLGDEEFPVQTLKWILTKAQGNPLFVEAYVEMVRGNGVRSKIDDAVPIDLLGIVEDRLNGLPDQLRRFIQIGSVLGRQFAPEDVLALMEDKDALPDNYVGLLSDKHLVQNPDGGSRLMFTHELIRDAIYFNLGDSLRRRLHQKFADVLADLPALGAVDAPTIAYHCERAQQPRKAIDWLQTAAKAAAQSGAMREAISYLERAVNLLETLEDDRERPELELALRSVEGPVRMVAGGPGSQDFGTAMDRSLALMKQFRPQSDMTHVHYNAGLHRWATAELTDAMTVARSLQQDCEIEPSEAKYLAANTLGGLISWHRGLNQEARVQLDNTLRTYSVERHAQLYPLFMKDFGVFANFYMALSCSISNEHSQAQGFAQQAEDLSQRLEFPHEVGFAGLAQIWTALFRGDAEAVLVHSLRTQKVSATYKFPEFTAMTLFAQGWVDTQDMSSLHYGIEKMRDGLEMWKQTKFKCWQGLFGALLGQGLIKAGQYSDAIAIASSYLDEIKTTHEDQWLVPLLTVRATAHQHQLERAKARADISKAADVAAAQGAPLWEDFSKYQKFTSTVT